MTVEPTRDITDLNYRWAGPDDAQLWLDFVREQQRATYDLAFGDEPERRARMIDVMRERLADTDSYHCLLAYAGDELVGLAATGSSPSQWEIEAGLTPSPADWELDKLYVSRAWHGNGLAERLMSEVIAKVPQPAGQEQPRVYLWLIDGNTRAQRFYEKHGFTHIEECIPCGTRTWAEMTMHRMVMN